MPRKENPKKLHFTMQGKAIDFDALKTKNEKAIAVGNVKTNARGDTLGKGGKIVKNLDNMSKFLYPNISQAIRRLLNA